MKDPLGVSPSKGNQGTIRGKEKIILTSVGIEPTISGLDLPSHSTLIYTSELILCSTICVHSATRHNIHMYPYLLFAAIYHLNRVRPRSLVGRVTVDLVRRSWVRFPPRSKEFFLYLVWFPDSLYRANAPWVFPGLHIAL